MKAFWESKFEELAIFNGDDDKEKFTKEYLKKMADLQEEYYQKQLSWAKENGYSVC